MQTLAGQTFMERDKFTAATEAALKKAGLKLKAPIHKAILAGIGERDDTAEICRLPTTTLAAQVGGHPEPDTDLNDTENVPLKENIATYFAREVAPHVPDLPAPRPAPGQFCIYVLKCSDDSICIGQTEDFPRRLNQHERGEVSWTGPRLPVTPIHWEVCGSREEAVKRESDLKTGFGRKWLKREFEAGRLMATSRQAGAWIDPTYRDAKDGQVGKVGYEIPFNRHFYVFQPPRALSAIDADLKTCTDRILNLIGGLTQ